MFFPQKLSPRTACPPCSWWGTQSAAIADPLRGLQVKGVAHKPAALCTPSLRNPTLPGSISGCSPLFNPKALLSLQTTQTCLCHLKKKNYSSVGLGCAGWAFFSYDEWTALQLWCLGFSLLWLLLLQSSGSRHSLQYLRHTDSRAPSQKLWCMGFVAPRHVGSSWTRNQTHVPCIGRQILNHQTTRAVQACLFYVHYSVLEFFDL